MFPREIRGSSVSNPTEVTRPVFLEDVIFIIISVEGSLDIISDKVTKLCRPYSLYVLRDVSSGVLVTCRVFVFNCRLIRADAQHVGVFGHAPMT